MLIGALLFFGVHLGIGCAVAAGSWESVRLRNPEYPAGVVRMTLFVVRETARWPLTLIGF